MKISKVIIKNYRCLSNSQVTLNEHLNIIVGDNECGKSTFLEAIHLALSGQLNGRPIQAELHPHLFNAEAVRQYVKSFGSMFSKAPPTILIELYFLDDPGIARFRGKNNSLRQDAAGVKLLIEFNEEYQEEYAEYVADPTIIRTIPVEYYVVRWRDFADNDITARSIPIKSSFIDASTIRNNSAASRYVLDLVKDGLSKKEQVDLALSYRLMKDEFLTDERVREINGSLDQKKGIVSQKTLSISLDTSSRASWELSVVPHLDDIPMPLVGKGEQNSVKIKLAMEASAQSHVFLIEEPENHLSFSNLSILISHISTRLSGRQLVLTTHSSFVLNKLGMDSVFLFRSGNARPLKDLPKDTYNYFMKLPGYDTLRLILAKRAILVEGPSDELIVQKAFLMRFGKMPLAMGVDVISVSSLAFKRFIDIAALLSIDVDVVTDNDGDVSRLEKRYKDYFNFPSVEFEYDKDETAKTLEPQLVKSNGLDIVNSIIGKSFQTAEDLLSYMADNKTECALKFFETDHCWTIPTYIKNVVHE
ncbi:AAA family ATPase [Bradyrhizobium sp. 180]|nr:AAA family ATPase [Bradyrhizobium sp. CW12]MCK1493347.1 AAA family ATPase [Bradyrhizobium sp. 180]MCK1593706.1 AAA family ATPase [Bradyrhizobium sp. 164]MCK1646143.1 AAA family ATPase [Bradyrhizobium sp. 154]MCK1665098.1 AAA family ATPase [Bradyrhizobium sp. 153]